MLTIIVYSTIALISAIVLMVTTRLTSPNLKVTNEEIMYNALIPALLWPLFWSLFLILVLSNYIANRIRGNT